MLTRSYLEPANVGYSTPSDPPAIAESNSSSNGTSITAQAVNAPVFVPRAASAISAQRAVTSFVDFTMLFL